MAKKIEFTNGGYLIDLASVAVAAGAQESEAIAFRTEHFGMTLHVDSNASGNLEVFEYMGPLDVGVAGEMADADFYQFAPTVPVVGGTPKKQTYSDYDFPPLFVRFTRTAGPDPYYLRIRAECNGA